jgi:hypothetical protein
VWAGLAECGPCGRLAVAWRARDPQHNPVIRDGKASQKGCGNDGPKDFPVLSGSWREHRPHCQNFTPFCYFWACSLRIASGSASKAPGGQLEARRLQELALRYTVPMKALRGIFFYKKKRSDELPSPNKHKACMHASRDQIVLPIAPLLCLCSSGGL